MISGLVNLNDYPRLRRYIEARKEAIAGRHCARKSPANWYRTIDRITPALTNRSKLLIPDIKGEAHIVFEDGNLYPHHNLYYITSESWDLRALQAVLLSNITRLFVASYLKRYDLLCQKLVQEQLYTTATLITSPRIAAETGVFSEVSAMTNLRTFVTTLADHIAATVARVGVKY